MSSPNWLDPTRTERQSIQLTYANRTISELTRQRDEYRDRAYKAEVDLDLIRDVVANFDLVGGDVVTAVLALERAYRSARDAAVAATAELMALERKPPPRPFATWWSNTPHRDPRDPGQEGY